MSGSSRTQIINFCCGPGGGKSTCATGVFSAMKRLNINCEYVPEFAKSLVWRGDTESLNDQIYVTGEQHHALFNLIGRVDYVLCDSPLFLGAIYRPANYPQSFVDMVLWAFNQYDNVNFLVKRRSLTEFNPRGRIHDLEQSRAKDQEIRDFLTQNNIPFHETSTDGDHVADVFKVLGIENGQDTDGYQGPY